MAFQFQCSQCANVLQAEEFQAGQQSYCPICGAVFLIPAPYAPPSPAAQPPGAAPAHGSGPFPAGRTAPPAGPGFPVVGPAASPAQPGFPVVGPDAAGRTAKPPEPEPREPDLLHIPCPECKKILETPVEMLDQDVLCPYCQAQFTLRRTASVEYKRKRQEEAEKRELAAGQTWLYLAIAVVVLVVLFLGALILVGF